MDGAVRTRPLTSKARWRLFPPSKQRFAKEDTFLAWEPRGKVTYPAGARALEGSFAPAEVPRVRCGRALGVARGGRRGRDGWCRVRRTSRVAHEQLWGYRRHHVGEDRRGCDAQRRSGRVARRCPV